MCYMGRIDLQKELHIVVYTLLIFMFFSGCGKSAEKISAVWNPPIKGLEWGMSSEDVQELYPFSTNKMRENDGTFWVELNEKVPVYGIDMEVYLSFYESENIMMGLQNMTIKCPEEYADKFELKLEERFKNESVSSTDKYGWKSWVTKDIVSDYYSSEQLWDAYVDRAGADFMTEHYDYFKGYIEGLTRSYLVSYKLKMDGEDSGFAVINGVRIAEMKYLFNEK